MIGEIFSPALEMQFVRFHCSISIHIRKYMSKYKQFGILNGTNCRLADYKY